MNSRIYVVATIATVILFSSEISNLLRCIIIVLMKMSNGLWDGVQCRSENELLSSKVVESVAELWIGLSPEGFSRKVGQLVSILARGRHTDSSLPVVVQVAQLE